MAPSVTVLIATYEFARFLGDAIESVLTQDYDGEITVHVFDDGSADDTAEVAAGYPVLYHHHENRGTVRNVGDGLACCEGDYIAFLSGDDVWKPGKLARQVQMLEENPALGLIYTDLEVVDDVRRQIHPSFWRAATIYPQRGAIAGFLESGNCVSGSTLIFRGQLREHCLPFPADARFDDWWVARSISRHAELDFIDEPLVEYRYHGRNICLRP
jgi:glycosyltransferase involved in cell wall biosynthesis